MASMRSSGKVMPSTREARALRSVTGRRCGRVLGRHRLDHRAGLATAAFKDQLRRAFDGAALQFEIDAALVAMRGVGRKAQRTRLAGDRRRREEGAFEEQVARRIVIPECSPPMMPAMASGFSSSAISACRPGTSRSVRSAAAACSPGFGRRT
jgi:hypothetical protein